VRKCSRPRMPLVALLSPPSLPSGLVKADRSRVKTERTDHLSAGDRALRRNGTDLWSREQDQHQNQLLLGGSSGTGDSSAGEDCPLVAGSPRGNLSQNHHVECRDDLSADRASTSAVCPG